MVTTFNMIYSEYFQASREQILYLQQIAVLIISAISIIYYNNRDIKKGRFVFLIMLAFLFSFTSLLIGFQLYSNLLVNIIDFITTTPNLTKGNSVYYNAIFYLDIVSSSCAMLSLHFIPDKKG